MSPRIPTAAGEQIDAHPEIGTPEYVRMQGLYDAAVERVAKLRHMETSSAGEWTPPPSPHSPATRGSR